MIRPVRLGMLTPSSNTALEPITYAMLYHSGGYFIHDSWWRDDYGPNTQFPHLDSSGDSFSFDGSHGCINVSTANAGWIYRFVDLHTAVVIY